MPPMSKLSDLPENLRPTVKELVQLGRERLDIDGKIRALEDRLAQLVIDDVMPKAGEELRTRRGEQLLVESWRPVRSRMGGTEATLVARQKLASGEWGKPKEFALYRLVHGDMPWADLANSVLGHGWWYIKDDEGAQS